jgi:hypothetical protein
MRAVFVNHCHPDTPHVCALRVTSFAHAMAVRGHQIVLISETLVAGDDGNDIAKLKSELSTHDWSEPFHLAVRPEHDATLEKLRNGQLPSGIRQLTIAKNYLFHSGVFGNWRRAAQPFLAELSRLFNPDVVWASFGNTDVWNIADDISKMSGCPWVADIKDNWSAFLPFGFTRLIANRFQRASALTAFSIAHQTEARKWFKQKTTVVYSGFDQVPINADIPATGKRLLVTGSLYDDEKVNVLVGGVRSWLLDRDGSVGPVEFRYAGGDARRFERLTKPLQEYANVIVDDYLDTRRLRSLQAGAMVNVYVYSPRSLFQHKPIEMLAAGRPILAVPGESEEVQNIARKTGCLIGTCETEEQIKSYLANVEADASATVSSEKVDVYSWQQQSDILQTTLQRAVSDMKDGE